MDDFKKVSRVEVIDDNGRSYVFDPRAHPDMRVKVSLSLQDQGRTLKVFIKAKNPLPAGAPAWLGRVR